MTQIRDHCIRLGIVASFSFGCLIALESAASQRVGREAVRTRVLVVESLTVASEDGKKAAVLKQADDRSASLLFVVGGGSRSLSLGIDDAGSPRIAADALNGKEAIAIGVSPDEPSFLDVQSPNTKSGFSLAVKAGQAPFLQAYGDSGEPRMMLNVVGEAHDTAGLALFDANGGLRINVNSSPKLDHVSLVDVEGRSRSILGLISGRDSEFWESDATSAPRLRFGWDEQGGAAVKLDDPAQRGTLILH